MESFEDIDYSKIRPRVDPVSPSARFRLSLEVPVVRRLGTRYRVWAVYAATGLASCWLGSQALDNDPALGVSLVTRPLSMLRGVKWCWARALHFYRWYASRIGYGKRTAKFSASRVLATYYPMAKQPVLTRTANLLLVAALQRWVPVSGALYDLAAVEPAWRLAAAGMARLYPGTGPGQLFLRETINAWLVEYALILDSLLALAYAHGARWPTGDPRLVSDAPGHRLVTALDFLGPSGARLIPEALRRLYDELAEAAGGYKIADLLDMLEFAGVEGDDRAEDEV